MNVRHPSENARLDFRLSLEHKRLIELAASHQGQSVTDFAVATLIKAAQKAIDEATVTTLSPRDTAIFLDMLDADPKPNAALKSAARRYKKSHG